MRFSGWWTFAVKATEARPGAQIVEREFGMFESALTQPGSCHRSRQCGAGAPGSARGGPDQTPGGFDPGNYRVDPYQAQLLNRCRRGSMLVAGETMLVLECAPAAYINIACNEAEKTASIKLSSRFLRRAFRAHCGSPGRKPRS